jgi:hypothetical protein
VPEKKEPMVQVLVRMPKSLAEALADLAARNDRSVAAEVRRACKRHLGWS